MGEAGPFIVAEVRDVVVSGCRGKTVWSPLVWARIGAGSLAPRSCDSCGGGGGCDGREDASGCVCCCDGIANVLSIATESRSESLSAEGACDETNQISSLSRLEVSNGSGY